MVLPFMLSMVLLQQTPGDVGEEIVDELWELAESATGARWIIIHHLEDAEREGLYHVEVLEWRHGDPPWTFDRLAAHLAVTKPALLESIVRPLESGHVYPERFEQALEAWRELESEGRAPVCDDDVLTCLGLRER